LTGAPDKEDTDAHDHEAADDVDDVAGGLNLCALEADEVCDNRRGGEKHVVDWRDGRRREEVERLVAM